MPGMQIGSHPRIDAHSSTSAATPSVHLPLPGPTRPLRGTGVWPQGEARAHGAQKQARADGGDGVHHPNVGVVTAGDDEASYGRDASHEAPPVQIRASGVTAHGSCLG